MKKIVFYVLAGWLLWACNSSNKEPAKTQSLTSNFILSNEDLPEYEHNLDHAYYISNESEEFYHKGLITYRTICFNCHGNLEQPGTIPNSHRFWNDTFKHGSDPYSIYETLTRGYGMMAPQVNLTPREKYEVIGYIRNEFIKENNPEAFFTVDSMYLANVPKGTSLGPDPQDYKPWAEMNYGNHLIHTYELSDESDTLQERSGGASPLKNENYAHLNFAYKGIAMRLDTGDGGVVDGEVFALFDHDLLRFTGFWTGKGFIDFRGILLNDEHNIYPRTVGNIQVENPIMPGWANPSSGTYNDPRFKAVDGRQFGPLPKVWAHYKGLYTFENIQIIKYTVAGSEVLERYALESQDGEPVISRTINIAPASIKRQLRIASITAATSLVSNEVILETSMGFHVLNIPANTEVSAKIFISKSNQKKVNELAASGKTENLSKYTQGGPAQYKDDILTTGILTGNEGDPYAVDVFTLPLTNPWKARMRLTGIDFINDGRDAIVCTIDGEVYRIEGISKKQGNIQWRRIATGLFQPLGIINHDGNIYVGCRDQIVVLRDLNGNGETDFYESFNSDHQVTEHFHEFAMGLQVDNEENFWYAKSARHARTALIPQHGTLIKVSPDGSNSEIYAGGFRAANGVCLNPDGSFYVTDQEGHWNPMNRMNKVTQGGWYGNMYTLQAPNDTSDAAMISPVTWIDSKYDRSPAELLWAKSDKWGPLSNKLLNLSYGYGKVFHVMTQDITEGEQGFIVELPIPQFPTGLIRARFNPLDGQFYGCGMSAWATSQMMQVGGLYRIRYTGKELNIPIETSVSTDGIQITFSDPLDQSSAKNTLNYKITNWDLLRSRKYGSDRLNTKVHDVKSVSLSDNNHTVTITLPDLKPSWVIEIIYNLKSESGKEIEGAIQGTVYEISDKIEI